MDWKKLTAPDRVLIAASLLFALDLLAFPWVDVSIGPLSYTSGGTGSPDGFLGILAVLLALALIAHLLVERLTATRPPSLALGASGTRFVTAAAALGLVVLKFILHLHPSYLGFGCWVALIVGAGLVLAAGRATQESADQVAQRRRSDAAS